MGRVTVPFEWAGTGALRLRLPAPCSQLLGSLLLPSAIFYLPLLPALCWLDTSLFLALFFAQLVQIGEEKNEREYFSRERPPYLPLLSGDRGDGGVSYAGEFGCLSTSARRLSQHLRHDDAPLDGKGSRRLYQRKS